ncbi:FAD-dependent oxidoreductase [Ideonella sp.]|uniref:FAD-dependent oxidoreductase n=1 Tax=Ideonella sp. TaxID=1929293 RepID=UPI0035AF2659
MSPPRPMRLTRRHWLAGTTAALLGSGCRRVDVPDLADVPARWVGTHPERGHRLRDALAISKAGSWPAPARHGRAGALVLGGGIAGLAAMRALVARGITDARLLELADEPGGNSRGHTLAGLACPLGAHYLPVPQPPAYEVIEWLHEIGLLRTDPLTRRTVPDERHLVHAPAERLFIDGAWQAGLLPSADGHPATAAQYRRFAAEVDTARRTLGFSLPTHRSPWTAGHAALDAQTFATWLRAQGFDDERLLAYLDYACRDDYGAGLATVSAWAGLHYFASRHGFDPGPDADGRPAPGQTEEADDATHGVFTWPEGNAWLARQLAAPHAAEGRLLTGRTVCRVDLNRHDVQVWAWDERAGHMETWTAPLVIVALPLFIAQRILTNPPPALTAAARHARYAPWLVANLHLDGPLADRPGVPPAWDSVAHAPAGSSTALGYVDAGHQAMNPARQATVLTAYHALPESQRAALLSEPAATWALRVTRGLADTLHPDLPLRLRAVELTRHGHAMRIPAPGVRTAAERTGLHAGRGRVRFVHADVAGFSVFEEAFSLGALAGGGGPQRGA